MFTKKKVMSLKVLKVINILTLVWTTATLIVIICVTNYLLMRHQRAYENSKTLKYLLKCNYHELFFNKKPYGEFWLLKNLFIGHISRNISCAKAVTFTTTSDYTYLYSLPTLIKRWQAPISVALYAPGYDFNKTMESIQFLRNCLPESQLIQDYVNFHIYFQSHHMPSYEPLDEDEAKNWYYNCSEPIPYLKVNRTELYKTQANLTYPINVGRNIARKAANTHFIFACDIELIPSPKVVPQFLQMIAKNVSVLHGNNGRRVFVLPIFEVRKKAKLPRSKYELQQMFMMKWAIPFHAFICPKCHRVPTFWSWLTRKNSKKLSIIAAAKRQGKFSYWEPLYISNNKEPMFDERVTWEHQHDKRVQCFALCLLNYEFLILHPAFLTHMPGIKRFSQKKVKYIVAMRRLIKTRIKPEYKLHYGNNSKCLV